MDNKTEPLDKNDWLDIAFDVLSETGHGGLRAQSLAKLLNVTRGSFYWHFADVSDFETALLDAWSERSTNRVIARLMKLPTPEERLLRLMKTALGDNIRLERAVRAWAVENLRAANTVRKVDETRYNYICDLLREMRVSENAIRPRSLILLWACIGRIMMSKKNLRSISDEELKELASMAVSA